MRIVAYLKQSKVAVFLIVLLLIVQAFADLSLPRYTSDLVDVGIQQGGIEEASPSVMREETYQYVCMLASDEDEPVSYTHLRAHETPFLIRFPKICRAKMVKQFSSLFRLHRARGLLEQRKPKI